MSNNCSSGIEIGWLLYRPAPLFTQIRNASKKNPNAYFFKLRSHFNFEESEKSRKCFLKAWTTQLRATASQSGRTLAARAEEAALRQRRLKAPAGLHAMKITFSSASSRHEAEARFELDPHRNQSKQGEISRQSVICWRIGYFIEDSSEWLLRRLSISVRV